MARLLVDTDLDIVYLEGTLGGGKAVLRHRKRKEGARFIVFPNLPDGLFYHLYADPSEPWKTGEVRFEGDNTIRFRSWKGKTDETIVAKNFMRR